MRYCPHCMYPSSGDYCAQCGKYVYDQNGQGLLPVGTLLVGSHRYQLGADLGQGGFGVTYIGLDLNTGERVAVKEYFPSRWAWRTVGNYLSPQPGAERDFESGRFNFLQEANTLATIEGTPAVVRGIEYLEANGTAYLVMEYLDGRPLYKMVEQYGRITADQLMPRLRPLLRDLTKLHRMGVLHRDIAPDNIMWMPDGSLKIMDFGNAKALTSGAAVQLAVKPGFAPIEQYKPYGQGTWTDVYGLAATIYYCLTGVIPPESIERYSGTAQLPGPISLGAALTPEEEAVVLWGMALEPKDRPVNMGVFSSRLFPFAAPNVRGRGTPPPPPPPPRRGGW